MDQPSPGQPAQLIPSPEDRPGEVEGREGEAWAITDRVIRAALESIGIPYRFGGVSPGGMDCSFFVRTAFDAAGVLLPRTAREMFLYGDAVEKDDLRPGDVVFFRTYARFPSHVGIYLGERFFVHASRKSRKVQVDSLDTPYFVKRFLGAKRLDLPPVGNPFPAH